jgi:hypothetical protein
MRPLNAALGTGLVPSDIVLIKNGDVVVVAVLNEPPFTPINDEPLVCIDVPRKYASRWNP